MEEKKNNSKLITIIVLSIIIILLISIIIFGVIYINNNNIQNDKDNNIPTNILTEFTNNETDIDSIKNINGENNTISSNSIDEKNFANTNTNISNPKASENETNSNTLINVANINGINISVPATKESFSGTGWTWDEKYANTDLATGYTTSGGRIGQYPGGAVVNVINQSGETKKIQDCIIDSITFYNPKNGSENVTFIGGLNYESSIDDVKNVFEQLGYKNVKEKNYENALYLTCYLDDNSLNYKDYIEFYFFKDSINSVTIKSSVK